MRKEPERADFECFKNCESQKGEAIRRYHGSKISYENRKGIIMELLKNKISTCIKKGEKIVQITLDDDYNVSDTKLDIDKIIDASGQILFDDVEVMANKIRVKGVVNFCILYHTGYLEKPIDCMEGKLPFEEMIHMDDILPTNQCQIIWEIEDLNVSVINSRKISLRALVIPSMSITNLIRMAWSTLWVTQPRTSTACAL